MDLKKALSELHYQIPPFSRDLTMKKIERFFCGNIFTCISEGAVAAASFGQVVLNKLTELQLEKVSFFMESGQQDETFEDVMWFRVHTQSTFWEAVYGAYECRP